jgi:ATP-dependent Lon protease
MITRSKRKIIQLEKNEIDETKVIKINPSIINPSDDMEVSSQGSSSSEMEISEDESEFSDDYEDFSEQLEQLKKNDKEAYDAYVLVIEEINKREPNIVEILKTPMRIKDKSKLVEMYEIYKNMDQPSEESLLLKDKIRVLYKKFKETYEEMQKLTQEKVDELKAESKKMKMFQPKMNLKQQILTLSTTPENKLTIYKKFKEFEELEGEEASKLRKWLSNAISIPHNKIKTTNFDQFRISEILNRVYKTLSEELYGMEKVKEQLMLFLNAKLQNSQMKGCSLGLIGCPGSGKTSIAKTLSKCLELPFAQISFGGVSDPEFLTGHDFTYIGSRPGEIVRSLQRMGYKNGILFLDEFEKVSSKKGITSSLLHITDFSQNNEFRDNYLADITIDLSNIWFIYSMNNYPEDSALRDRIFYIEVEGYSIKDKIQIVKNYLLPKALLNVGKLKDEISFVNEDAIYHFINKIDKNNEQKGVRTIEKAVKDLVNKIHFLVSNKDMLGNLQTTFKISFNDNKIRTYPIILDTESIDRLVKTERKDEDYLRMFL